MQIAARPGRAALQGVCPDPSRSFSCDDPHPAPRHTDFPSPILRNPVNVTHTQTHHPLRHRVQHAGPHRRTRQGSAQRDPRPYEPRRFCIAAVDRQHADARAVRDVQRNPDHPRRARHDTERDCRPHDLCRRTGIAAGRGRRWPVRARLGVRRQHGRGCAHAVRGIAEASRKR